MYLLFVQHRCCLLFGEISSNFLVSHTLSISYMFPAMCLQSEWVWTTVGAGQLPCMSLCYTFRLGVMVLLVVKINFDIFEIVILPKYFILMLINGMANNHAPGSGLQWILYQRSVGPSLIKQDFIRLVKDFFNTSMDISSLNYSLIALFPKKSNPEAVDDHSHRPIFLLNYSLMKSITKLLSQLEEGKNKN